VGVRRRHHRLLQLGSVVLTATAVAAAAAAPEPPQDPGWTGVPHCTVPQVKGVALAKAKTRLTNARCGVGFVVRQRSTVKKGAVIYPLPKAGSILAPQTAVDLYVSRGRR
jgi:beta-lactam-binding protein with PASTA domain